MNVLSVPSCPALPIVRRWKLPFWFPCALLFLVLQLLSGTSPVYALLVFALLAVSYYAILWAGGLGSLFGIAILYLLLQHVLVAQIAKVFLWEPADIYLRRPVETMGVYTVGMASLALGVLLSNHLRRRKGPLFAAETKPNRLLWMSLFCTIFYTLITLVTRTVGVDARTGGALEGGALGPLKQISFLGPLAIASGTAYMIKSSGGRRSIGLINAIPIMVQTAFNVLNASREGTVSPTIIFIVTCIAFRYRFRLKHYALLLIGAYIANYIIFPYALLARSIVRTGSFETNVSRSVSMLGELIQNPFKYRDQVDNINSKHSWAGRLVYYSHSSATLDRYTLITYCDGIVDATITRGETGWETIKPGFEASLPRFLNPDKPFVNTGNWLSHREPGISPGKKDYTTGISTGFFPDAFSSFGWLGVSVIPCLIMLCLMTLYRLLINDRIWGNVLMLSLATDLPTIFSEGTVANLITLCLTGAFAAGVGFSVLYVLVHAFDRLTDRLRNAWIAGIHPRRQALQRIMATTPHTGKILGITRGDQPGKV
jgi:hypothetical protein